MARAGFLRVRCPAQRPAGPLRGRARRLLLLVGPGALRGIAACAALLAARPGSAQTAPTFTQDVAPLLYRHCVTCHRPGEVGGFSLISFADVRPRAAAIARVTRSRTMPPWTPDLLPDIALVGERRMSDAEIDVIARWATSGAAEGDPAHLPPLPNLPDGWRLGTPDLEITMTEPYTLRPGGADVLRNFILPVPLTTRRWVRGLEFRTDNRRVVHHANIRIDSTGTSRQLDASDGEPGFDGRLNGGAEFPEGQFLGWTPGQQIGRAHV